MRPVAVRIFHPEPAPDAGPLERWVGSARAALADRHVAGFRAAGASDVRNVSGAPDRIPFGRRLRELVRAERPDGLVILGSGAIPLATAADRVAFVQAAAATGRSALANSIYSADVVAIATATDGLADLPDLDADNALPRWLSTEAGYDVRDLRRRWRLAIDIDGPIDLVLTGTAAAGGTGVDLGPVRERIVAVRRVAGDVGCELLVAGRTSSGTVAWLERRTASRTRVLIEERGLRTSVAGQRAAASVLGLVLDRDGPDALGTALERLADAAVVDTRVLLAHRFGADERGWPPAEDRFASDLLLADRIADPWLRTLTIAARDARIPVLFGGHTLVGPGIRLLLGRWAA
jgi:hypothetical protein